MRIFIDDDRNHFEDDWVHVRTVPALLRTLAAHGDTVTHLSFDNDLRQPEEGWEGLRDIIEMKMDDPGFLPRLEAVYVQSLNTDPAIGMVAKMRNAIRAGIFPDTIVVERRPALDGIYPLAREDPRTVTVLE